MGACQRYANVSIPLCTVMITVIITMSGGPLLILNTSYVAVDAAVTGAATDYEDMYTDVADHAKQ